MVQLRKTTLGYREKMEQDAKEITVMEDGLEELTMEVDGLEEKVSRAAKKTELLRQKYESPDGTKHKVHVEE